MADRAASLDSQLDAAIRAVNRGDVTTARDLAEQVLAADASSRDAAALLGIDGSGTGEVRRLTLLFCDLVGSTEMSARHEPELYRSLVRRYTAVCREVVDRYHGYVSHIAGDGLLAAFGLPTPHENDAERAVRAGLDIVRRLQALSPDVEAVVGERLAARAAVHRGVVFLDPEDDEIYGLAANVAARLHGLAEPDTLVISDEVLGLVDALFETRAQPAQQVKGVEEPLRSHRVVTERPQAAARGRRWAAPLVGRGRELDALREGWTRQGDGCVALHLVGEAGVGKSRLAAVFADEVLAGGGECLQLLGSPFHAEANFSAVRAALEGHCGLSRDAAADERLDRLRSRLAGVGLAPDEMVPLLAPVLDIAPADGYRAVEADSRKLRDAIAGGAARYLLACLGSGPAVLVADDLHWCDESSVDVVARVLGAARPGLMVLTVSREPPPAVLGTTDVIALAPLDDDDAAELVRALDTRLDEAACRSVVARGDGVPLFLEELACTSGVGARVDSGRRRREPVPPGATGPTASGIVPDALYDPLVARLYSTGIGARVAAAAAAIGRDVERPVLARVAEVSPPDLDVALAALVDERILVPVPGDGERYRFRHELVRVVAYDLQPPSRRRRLHGRVADALLADSRQSGALDWRLVAGHREAAGLPAEAADAYRNAADGARRLGALDEARTLLGRALDLLVDIPDGTRRRVLEVGLRLRRGFLAASSEGNNSPDAVEDYERCLELGAGLAGIVGDDALFNTLVPLYGYYIVRGDLGRAEQVAEELRLRLPGARQSYEPDNDAAFGMIRWYAGDFAAARTRLEASVAGLATRTTAPDYAGTYFMPNDGPGSAHANLAVARFMGGDVRGADAQLDAARQRCRAIEYPQGPFTAAFTESYAVWTLLERGDLRGAEEAQVALGRLADRHGFDLWDLIGSTEAATVAGLATLAASPGDGPALVARAEAIESLCAAWRMIDLATFLPYFTAVAGRLRATSGDLDGAAARYEEASGFAAATGIRFYDAEVMRLQAQLAGGEAARHQLHAALALARAQGAVPFELRIARDLVALGGFGAGAGATADLALATTRFAPDTHYPELDDARSLATAR